MPLNTGLAGLAYLFVLILMCEGSTKESWDLFELVGASVSSPYNPVGLKKEI